MRHFVTTFFLLLLSVGISAKTYYIATNGNDSNEGTIAAPFATIKKAQDVAAPGDIIYIRGGVYQITEDQIMNTRSPYACVFDMTKSGLSNSQRICYWGYEGERPIFDLSEVKPSDQRVSVFYITGSYLHFKNFEIIGTQVTIIGHTQSECISNRGGSNNIYENLAMHDGMAIGFYLTEGSNNLVLNCDAYNNYDTVSDDGYGGNVDGFGAHITANTYTGNIFRGCRAWYNSDDGYDLINCHAAVIIDNCWSFYNGYQPGTLTGAGDGSGFKSGGYGMSGSPNAPAVIPQHKVQNCLAFYNRNQGFYANHHLGGIAWYNNTGYKNPSNFNMLNRKSATEAVDDPDGGYGHILQNNISFAPRRTDNHIVNVNESLCEIYNNSFLPDNMTVTEADFVSLDETQLMLPRKADGSLPDIDFLKLNSNSTLYKLGMGYTFTWGNYDINYGWLSEATILIEGTIAKVVGPGAGKFSRFFINNQEIAFSSSRIADISSYSGTIELKASTIDATGNIKLKINK